MLIDDTEFWLRRELDDANDQAALTIALASWFAMPIFPEELNGITTINAMRAAGASRRHQDVAIVGYHLSKYPHDEASARTFREGVQWLMGRAAFVTEGVPSGLLLDWPSILGIHSGLYALGEAKPTSLVEWFRGICDTAEQIRGGDQFRHAVISYVLAAIDGRPYSCPNLFSDFQAALHQRGDLSADEIDWQSVWKLATEVASCGADQNRHLIRLVAIHAVRKVVGSSDLSVASKAQLLALAKGIQHSFLRWPWEIKPRTRRDTASAQRWDLQNEYHFQSLLWAVIKPVFGDLEEETYMPRTGQLQPRADLCLPSIKTVIEVKFWYAGHRATKLIEEIAADHSLYLRSGSPYDSLLALVWDDQRRTEEHGELIRGLEGLQGILGVIVVSRPARMEVIQTAESVLESHPED